MPLEELKCPQCGKTYYNRDGNKYSSLSCEMLYLTVQKDKQNDGNSKSTDIDWQL